jgi:DNA-binding response OmpR family regulator
MPGTNDRPVVLVADDEPSMLELVTQHLKTMEKPELEVLEASDGEIAWKLAQEHLPDLVVLDVMMPGMSGWEVCRKIREDVALAHTAVVMLTGIGENLNQMTSPLYGADQYLDKPFEFEELDEKVRQALASREKQRGGVSRPKTNGVHHAAAPAKSLKVAPAKLAKPAPKSAVKLSKAAPAKKATKPAAKAAAKPAAKPAAKAAAKKSAPKKTAKKAAAKAPIAKKAAPKKTAKKSAAKAPAKKTGAKKPAAKKAPGKKTAKKMSKKR